jgi:hypothetical protein
MRGGGHYYTHTQKALTEIGIATTHGSSGPDLAVVGLDELYRPATSLCWHRHDGWTLNFDGRPYADNIAIGPPDMTPAKAARACAALLTEQAKRQEVAIRTAVRKVLAGEELIDRLGWQRVADLREGIVAAFRADVLAEQDGAGRG